MSAIGALPLLDPDPPDPADGPGAGEPVYLAVIEAARGSANKLKFDPALGVFRLHGVLPAGMVYPWDFGFLPATKGEDGDPLDVLVLMDEAVPVGHVVSARLLGVIEAEQAEDDRRVRNDRLVAVAIPSHRHAHCRVLDDLPAGLLDQIEGFFVAFNAQRGQEFRPLGRRGPDVARRRVDEGAKAVRP